MKKTIGLSSIVLLQFFTVFPEYFVGISLIYVLIVIVLITYNVYGLLIQKALSECIALILFMACYLILNDDLLQVSYLTLNNSFAGDYMSYITKLVVCFFSALYFLLISDSLKEQKLTSFEYLLTTLFAVLGFMLMCSSYDFLTAYLSIELSSLSLYILASFKKNSSYSIESGLKYFITGAVSSAFFLLGASFVYVFTGTINFYDLYYLLSSSHYLGVEPLGTYKFPGLYDEFTEKFIYILYKWWYKDYGYLPQSLDIYFDRFDCSFYELGLVLISFSLFIKLAAAPFHLWSLDVYEGSPTTASFFFATISKFSIFVLMTRFLYVSAHHTMYYNWPVNFFWVGFFSVFVGSLGGLKQRKIKTLLAYSSITNMGYALFAFGSNNYFGLQAICLHLTIYMLSGLCTWSILLLLRLKTKTVSNKYSKELCDLALLRKSNPALAFALSLTMFSIAGIPPLIGFLAKMGIFFTLIMFNRYALLIPSAVLSILATFYYIRIIKVIYFENLLVGKLYYPIKTSQTLILSVLIFSLMFLFIDPCMIYLISCKLIPVRPL